MAQIVSGDREVFNYMMFGSTDPGFQQYVNQTNNYFGNMFTQVGRQFVDTAKNMFARMESSEAMQLAKAALRRANVYFQEDIIYQMNTVEQLQEAPNCMVKWLMAEPTVRQLYLDNRVEGYGERYENKYRNEMDWTLPEYAQVYDGWIVTNPVVTVNEETGEEIIEEEEEFNIVFEDEEDWIPEILDEEALMIQSAHHLIAKALKEKRDPTSFYDNYVA